MSRRKKLGVLLLAACAGFVVCEVAVRALGVGVIPEPKVRGATLRRSLDEKLRTEHLPGGQAIKEYRDRRGEVVLSAVEIINAQGFRGPAVVCPKPAGTFRIACVGDSQTFGSGVSEDDAWPAVVQEILRSRSGESRCEVMNWGHGGYETEQEVALLEERLPAFEPDLVILGFFLNDTALPGTAVESPDDFKASVIRFLAPGDPERLFTKLRKYSKLLDLGADWQFRKLVMQRWFDQREPYFRDDFPGWIRVQAAIRRGREIVEARGGRFAVLLVPLLMRHGDELLTSEPYRKVSAFLRAEKVPYFDPEPSFAGLEVDPMRVHPRDLHSGPQAQWIVGEGLARWLAENGLAPFRLDKEAPR